MGIISFRVRRPETGAIDTDLYDVTPLRDAFKRFAGGATLRFRDPNQTKINDYPYGTRVEVQVNEDAGNDQFKGVFVAGFGESQAGFGVSDAVALSSRRGWWTRGAFVTLEPSRTTQDGLSIVEVDAVGYNHLLTREQIIKDYSSSAKTTILKDVIKTFTPATYDSDLVDVQDDSAIDLSLRGATPAEAVEAIAARSADEEWTVNDEFTFKFGQQDSTRANPVGDADVLDHDLPERGARAINKFTVYYGASLDKAWTEEDRASQKQLQDQIDADRPVVIAESDAFPEITTEDEAKKKAQERLDDQSVAKTGTIETPLGALRARAGDVFSLTLSEAGISGADFAIAQIDYDWNQGVTRRTIAQNTGGNVDELLVSLSESLTNERLQDVDTAATVTNALRLTSELDVIVESNLQTKTAAAGQFTLGQSELGLGTDDELGGGLAAAQETIATTSSVATVSLLNLLRDLWQDGSSAFVDLTHVSVGTDDADATRADDALGLEVDRVAAVRYGETNAATQAELVFSVPAGGVAGDAADLVEFGAQDAATGGSLYAEVVTQSAAIDADTRLTGRLLITLDNDSAGDGVITNTGQKRWLDLLLGESGHEPTSFVYGDGGGSASVSDTSLANQIHEDAIDARSDGSTGIAKLVERVTTSDTSTGDINELGQENSSNELLSRFVFDEYGSAVDIETTHSFEAHNP